MHREPYPADLSSVWLSIWKNFWRFVSHDILDESRPVTLWNVPQLGLVCFSAVSFVLHKLLHWNLTGRRKHSPSLVVEGLANSPPPCFGGPSHRPSQTWLICKGCVNFTFYKLFPIYTVMSATNGILTFSELSDKNLNYIKNKQE